MFCVVSMVLMLCYRLCRWKPSDEIAVRSRTMTDTTARNHTLRNQPRQVSFIHSFIHFCHAPLWVRSAKRRQHSPEWMILSHVNCFIQGEVQWFQVMLGSLHPRSTGCPGGLLQFSKGKAVKICLVSDSSDICTIWPNRERCRAWTVAKKCGCCRAFGM